MQIEQAIATPLASKNLEVVQIRLLQGETSKRLQILIENNQTGKVTLDECADASRLISAILDVEDCVAGRYALEVSSPGIDRPLIKQADYETYLGFEAVIETNLPVDGRRRFKGQLLKCEANEVHIKVDNATFVLPMSNIRQAKLVTTDALLKAHKEGRFLRKKELTESQV